MYARFAFLRKAVRRWCAPLACLALAACEPVSFGGATGGPSINTSEPIPVALLVPKGSGTQSDAILAQSLENAARLAIADLSEVEINLRVYDTAASASTAAAQAVTAVNDGAKIILGPVYAEAANAVGVAVAPSNVNVLAFSNNTSIAGGNVFVLGPTFDNTARRLVSYAVGQGKQSIAIVHGEDIGGQTGRAAVQTAIAGGGAILAGTESYAPSQQSVVAAIPNIKSMVDLSDADAVFLTAPSAGALPLLTQLMPEQGLTSDVVQYIGLTRWDIPPQTLDLPGVQGGWFALPDPNRSAAFGGRYEGAYGGAPHPIGGLAYDGIAAIGALVSQGRSNALTGAALTQNAGFQGATGIFRLRADGTNERGLAVATVRDGRSVVIDAAPQAFGGAGS